MGPGTGGSFLNIKYILFQIKKNDVSLVLKHNYKDDISASFCLEFVPVGGWDVSHVLVWEPVLPHGHHPAVHRVHGPVELGILL